jgi:hypothetical protein
LRHKSPSHISKLRAHTSKQSNTKTSNILGVFLATVLVLLDPWVQVKVYLYPYNTLFTSLGVRVHFCVYDMVNDRHCAKIFKPGPRAPMKNCKGPQRQILLKRAPFFRKAYWWFAHIAQFLSHLKAYRIKTSKKKKKIPTRGGPRGPWTLGGPCESPPRTPLFTPLVERLPTTEKKKQKLQFLWIF